MWTSKLTKTMNSNNSIIKLIFFLNLEKISVAKQLLEIDAKFYLCIFIYLHVFNVHMHSKGVLFPLEFVPFFMSRLCICCTLEMSQKPKNKISRTKILGEKKSVSCGCLNKTVKIASHFSRTRL